MFQYHEVFALENTDMDPIFYNTNLSDWWEDVGGLIQVGAEIITSFW